MSGIPQQQNMMQTSRGQRNNLIIEPGFADARQFIQERIYDFLMQRQKTQEIATKKVMDIVRRLEEGLFKTATTKEEYMNLETFENRLHALIRSLPWSNQSQQYQQQGGNSMMSSSLSNTTQISSGMHHHMVPWVHLMTSQSVNLSDDETMDTEITAKGNDDSQPQVKRM
ncbi:hypothetical protein L2E82_17756 [Cichorium intybus]|uniref:Uncharacterized protein n=1 Tax=Cichorium intybus TaxID=13427 RepID=A0ACB9F9P4_CICIN|nr:hypothetical protein L2E82_17756 [Cichorium intybus]